MNTRGGPRCALTKLQSTRGAVVMTELERSLKRCTVPAPDLCPAVSRGLFAAMASLALVSSRVIFGVFAHLGVGYYVSQDGPITSDACLARPGCAGDCNSPLGTRPNCLPTQAIVLGPFDSDHPSYRRPAALYISE